MAPEREEIQGLVKDIVGPYPSMDAKLLTIAIDLLIDIRDKMYEPEKTSGNAVAPFKLPKGSEEINNLGPVAPIGYGDISN